MPWSYGPSKVVFPVILPPSVLGLTKAIKRNVLQPPVSLVATRAVRAEEATLRSSAADQGRKEEEDRPKPLVAEAAGDPALEPATGDASRPSAAAPGAAEAAGVPGTGSAVGEPQEEDACAASPAGPGVLPPGPPPSPAPPAAPPPPGSQGGDEPIEATDSGDEADAEGSAVHVAAAAAERPAEGSAGAAERAAGPASSPASSPASASTTPAPAGAPLNCDRCDGKHPTDACPHFKKPRENHKDAWVNYNRKKPLPMGKDGGNFILRNCRCVPQPGDGSCLFHSLCFGLNGGKQGQLRASDLRWELANFIETNPRLEIAGDTIEEWVRWDADTSVAAYARRMAVSGWGGGIEMAACSLLKKVNVHVYERRWLGGYRRISCFDCPEGSGRSIHVLYQGGMHYDALLSSS